MRFWESSWVFGPGGSFFVGGVSFLWFVVRRLGNRRCLGYVVEFFVEGLCKI